MKNELIELLKTRRSIRSFTDREIEPEKLRQIAEAAVYAPSAMNRQSWHFAVICGREKLDRLAAVVRVACGRDEGYNFYRPAAMIIASNERDFRMGVDDCACALQNIFLAAHALGVGSVWINQIRDVCDVPEVRAVLTEFGVPENQVVYGSAALGYAANPPKPAEKKLGNISYC